MSMSFNNSIFSGGTFINKAGDNDGFSSKSFKGFKILHGRIAVDAFHNSVSRSDAPKCYPNTRLAVLNDIMYWVQDLARFKAILWLYGPAGGGKSAIAQTIAEVCADLGLLLASFFFFRSSPLQNNEKRLIASIAYQLALSIPETRPLIGYAVYLDPSIFDKSMEIQIETLIIVPLETVRSTVAPSITDKWPKLILIDGLDECNGELIQRSIINALSTAILRHRVPLILFIASRPEPPIRNALNVSEISNSSHHIVLDNSYDPDADIKEFLSCRFKEIRESHPLATFIPGSWPSAEIIDRLVQKSSGQFIYASTVLKYLDSSGHSPTRRLDVVIGLLPVGGDSPYKQLDALYTHLFSCVKDISGALQIIGFLLLMREGQPTPEFLECLLGLDQGHVHLCLSELHSILDIPPPTAHNKPIRIFHASLSDFLVDELRSRDYHLDGMLIHAAISQYCLPRISILTLKNCQTSTIDDRVTWYSILNFAYHCSRASTNSTSLRDNLMRNDVLKWFGRQCFNLSSLDILFFFQWLEKADTSGRLLSHVRNFWDRLLLLGLDEYTSKINGVNLVVIFIFPGDWALQCLSVSKLPEYPDTLHSYIPPKCDHSPREREAHCQLFLNFLEDRKRSGRYHITRNDYARTALQCLQYGFTTARSKITLEIPFLPITYSYTKTYFSSRAISQIDDPSVLTSVLNSLAILLSKASPLYSLYRFLRDHPLQIRDENGDTTKMEPLAHLKLAMEAYIEKYESNHPFAKWQWRLSQSMFKLPEMPFPRRRYNDEPWRMSHNTLTSYQHPPNPTMDSSPSSPKTY